MRKGSGFRTVRAGDLFATRARKGRPDHFRGAFLRRASREGQKSCLESWPFRGYHWTMFLRPLLAAVAILSTPLLAAENWPEFRGPSGDGHSDAKGLPVTF